VPDGVRKVLEPRFGHSFANVKVYSDAQAAQIASDLDAKAFTVGENIAFNKGRYAPEDPVGLRLLSHELVHTMQQGPVRGKLPDQLEVSQVGDASEHQARASSTAHQPPPTAHSSGPAVQLEGEEEEPGPIASPASVQPGVSYPGDTDVESSAMPTLEQNAAPAPELNYTPGPSSESVGTMERRATPYGSFDVYSDDYPMSLAPAGPKAEAQRVTEGQLQNIDSNLMNIDAGGGGMALQGNDAFKDRTKTDLAYLMTSQAGMGLVEDIPRTGQNMTIAPANPNNPDPTLRSNSELPANKNMGMYRQDFSDPAITLDPMRGPSVDYSQPGPGSDATVYYDPNRTRTYDLATVVDGITYRPDPSQTWVERSPAIGLGHEMIHGINDMQGTTATGKTEVTNVYNRQSEIENAELQAVGLPFSGPGDTEYSENDLRAQLGEQRRERY
jgi:hypothetical protein